MSSNPGAGDLVAALRAHHRQAQEDAARELATRDDAPAMMALYDFVRDETGDPAARRIAAESLVRRGLLRRERAGPSLMFLWMAFLTAVVVIVAAASIAGPVAAAVCAAAALALGIYVLRRRRLSEEVYIGPQGERLRFGPEPGADIASASS